MQVVPRATRIFRVCYVFAGAPRKADVRSFLEELARRFEFTLTLYEVDLLRCETHDVTDTRFFEDLLKQDFDAYMISPPCSTWSRARNANKKGPPVLRSNVCPWGFPWLRGTSKDQAELGNELIRCAFKLIETAISRHALWLLEHPEDLGNSRSGWPGSIWQLPQLRTLVQRANAVTVALQQPTRLAGNLDNMAAFGWTSWPQVSKDGQYRGPLPRNCGHDHAPLIGINDEGVFATQPTAAYPPALCEAIAEKFVHSWLRSPDGGGKVHKTLISECDAVRPASATPGSQLPPAVLQPSPVPESSAGSATPSSPVKTFPPTQVQAHIDQGSAWDDYFLEAPRWEEQAAGGSAAAGALGGSGSPAFLQSGRQEETFC